MEEEIIKYVQNQLVQGPFRLRFYVQDESGKKYPTRNIYVKIEKYLKEFISGENNRQNRWVIIPGLRGVGKTTAMAQLFLNHYRNIEERRILYISLNEAVDLLGSSLKDVLAAYEQILGESFEKISKPVLIFIDEAQSDPKWAAVLKSIYDRSNKVFILCSGSSAVSLQTNSDVARRAIFEKMYPANFCEFLLIRDGKYPVKNLKKEIKNALFRSESAPEAFQKLKDIEGKVISFWAGVDRNYVDEYLKVGTLPFAIRMKDEARVYQSINILLDKVINQDVQGLGRFDVATIGHIKRILFLTAEAESISLQKLKDILGISINTVANIFDILEKAEILIRIMPYGSNFKKVRKPSKYLFMSSAMRSALLSIAGNEQIFAAQKGHLMEDIAGLTLFRNFIGTGQGSVNYDSSKAAADFILTIARENIIPMEIGAGLKDASQVSRTMGKIHSAKYGIVVCRNSLALSSDKTIIKVPWDYFLLI